MWERPQPMKMTFYITSFIISWDRCHVTWDNRQKGSQVWPSSIPLSADEIIFKPNIVSSGINKEYCMAWRVELFLLHNITCTVSLLTPHHGYIHHKQRRSLHIDSVPVPCLSRSARFWLWRNNRERNALWDQANVTWKWYLTRLISVLFTVIFVTCRKYSHWYIIGILCGYAIRSGRHPEGSQRPPGRPQVGPGRWLPEGCLPDRIA